MFQFFIENKLIPTNQSGFEPRESCIDPLLSITHVIQKSFDDGQRSIPWYTESIWQGLARRYYFQIKTWYQWKSAGTFKR